MNGESHHGSYLFTVETSFLGTTTVYDLCGLAPSILAGEFNHRKTDPGLS